MYFTLQNLAINGEILAHSPLLTLSEESETCSALDAVLDSFVTSHMSCLCSLKVILVGSNTGKVDQ